MDAEHKRMKGRDMDVSLKTWQEDAAGICIEDGSIILNYAYPYCIELSRCNTPGKILGWVNQLAGKTWMNTHRLNLFIGLAFEQIGIEIDYAI